MDQSDDLLRRARTGIELLRPHPHRGDLIAAGAVPLTVALLLIDVRLEEPWGSGIFLVLNALGAALLLCMGVLAPMEGDRPRAYQVVLHLCGLTLLLLALYRLAEVLGADDPLGSAGNVFWILGLTTGVAAWLARERRSAVCALAGAITGTIATLAFVDWVFDPSGQGTTRWILLLIALGLLAGALVLRDRRRRESVYLIDAAGLAILLLGLTWLAQVVFGFAAFGDDGGIPAPGAGWKVVLLAAGLGLVAYAGVDQEPGPAYLGVLILLVFVLLVGAPGEGGPSLWFWPAVLLLVGAAMIGAGLRPREPLPPEPVPPGAPAAPPAPVRGPFAGAAGAAGPAPAPDPAGAAAPPRPRAAGQDEAAKEASAEAASPPAPAAGTVPGPAATSAPPPAPEPSAPTPPARGSLWARADPGEQPTRQQPAVRPSDDDAPTEVRPPGDR